MASAYLKPDFDFTIKLTMSTFLKKKRKTWRNVSIFRSMKTTSEAIVVPIQKLVGTTAKRVVQPEVPLMSLPYELLIQIMDSVPILYRSMTLSSFRL